MTLLTACGHEAAPLLVSLDLNGTSTTVRGMADPDASAFDGGFVVWTRWAVEDPDVALVELALDVRRDVLPAAISETDPPTTLSSATDSVRATLRQRGQDGKIRLEIAAVTVTVTVQTLAERGSAELSRGTFNVVLPDGPGVLYDVITGSWVSKPAPEDAAVDDNATAPTEETASGGSGCDCGGGEAQDPAPSGSDDNTTSGGSGCAGDNTGDDEEPPAEPDEEPSSDTSTAEEGSGCDCQGDESVGAGRSLSGLRLRVPCRASPLRVALEASPLLAIYGLERRRRRWLPRLGNANSDGQGNTKLP